MGPRGVTAGHLGESSALLDICRAVRGLPPLTAEPHPLDPSRLATTVPEHHT